MGGSFTQSLGQFLPMFMGIQDRRESREAERDRLERYYAMQERQMAATEAWREWKMESAKQQQEWRQEDRDLDRQQQERMELASKAFLQQVGAMTGRTFSAEELEQLGPMATQFAGIQIQQHNAEQARRLRASDSGAGGGGRRGMTDAQFAAAIMEHGEPFARAMDAVVKGNATPEQSEFVEQVRQERLAAEPEPGGGWTPETAAHIKTTIEVLEAPYRDTLGNVQWPENDPIAEQSRTTVDALRHSLRVGVMGPQADELLRKAQEAQEAERLQAHAREQQEVMDKAAPFSRAVDRVMGQGQQREVDPNWRPGKPGAISSILIDPLPPHTGGPIDVLADMFFRAMGGGEETRPPSYNIRKAQEQGLIPELPDLPDPIMDVLGAPHTSPEDILSDLKQVRGR